MYVLFTYVGLAVLSFVRLFTNRYKKIDGLILIGFSILLIVRYTVGSDSWIYEMVFQRSIDPIYDFIHFDDLSRNIGFNAVIWLSKTLFGEYRYFMLVFNLIIISLCSYTIYKYSENPLISMTLFTGIGIFALYFSSHFRQMLAMAIFLYAFYQYLMKGKVLKYIIAVLIASLCHDAAFICILLPLITQNASKISKHLKTIMVVLFCLALGVALFLQFALPVLIQNLPIAVYRMNIFHLFRYLFSPHFSIASFIRYTLIGIATLLLFLKTRDSDTNDMSLKQMLVLYFSFLFYLCFSNYSLVARFCDVLNIICIIYWANQICAINTMKIKTLLSLIIFCFCGLLLVNDLKDEFLYIERDYPNITFETYPYYTVFDSVSIQKYENKHFEVLQ